VVHAGPIIAKRELILRKGSWRDLAYAEDWELVSRIGFNIHLPIVIGFNEAVLLTHREKRYGGTRRLIKAYIDLVRGEALSTRNLLSEKSKRLLLVYIPARLLGFYQNRNPDNHTWVELACLIKAIPPREAGINDEFFHMRFTLKYLCNYLESCESTIDSIIRDLVGNVYKFSTRIRENIVLCYKKPEYLDKSYLPAISRVTMPR
jgi:hypothetical protein